MYIKGSKNIQTCGMGIYAIGTVGGVMTIIAGIGALFITNNWNGFVISTSTGGALVAGGLVGGTALCILAGYLKDKELEKTLAASTPLKPLFESKP